MPRYDEGELERFKRQLGEVGIVRLLESYEIPLKKKGINHFAICPFHEEKTGSFSVSDSRQMYYCFGCHAGGDVIKFVMDYEKAEFPDAVRILAQRFNLPEPRTMGADEVGRVGTKKKLEEIIGYATDWFVENLWRRPCGEEARKYLFGRGFTEETLRARKIGCAPATWDAFLAAARPRGYSTEELEQAGLLTRKQEGPGFYDRFRNRVIFPLQDAFGRYVGFAGRTLDKDNDIKYLNSPQTTMYDKGKILYCLNLARLESIKKVNMVVVVEGYTDALMAQQHGLHNTVALCGVSLTQHHAIALRKLFDNAVVALDPDEAGDNAAMKSAMTLMNAGVSVRLLRLPSKDLDEVLLEEGVDKVRERVSSAIPLYEFEIEKVLRGKEIAKMIPDEKKIVLKELMPFLSYCDGITQCRLYIEETAKKLGIDYKVALAAYSEYKKPREGIRKSPFASERAEFEALALMLRTPYANFLKEHLTPEHFTDESRRALFHYLSSNGGSRLFEASEMLPDSSLFDSMHFKPADALEFCRKNSIPVNEHGLYALVSRLQSFSASNLHPDSVLFHLKKHDSVKRLGELEQCALAAQARGDSAGVVDAFNQYVAEYVKFKAPCPAPSDKAPQG